MNKIITKRILIVFLLIGILSVPLIIEKTSSRQSRNSPEITQEAAFLNQSPDGPDLDKLEDEKRNNWIEVIVFHTISVLGVISVVYFIGYKLIKESNEKRKQ